MFTQCLETKFDHDYSMATLSGKKFHHFPCVMVFVFHIYAHKSFFFLIAISNHENFHILPKDKGFWDYQRIPSDDFIYPFLRHITKKMYP